MEWIQLSLLLTWLRCLGFLTTMPAFVAKKIPWRFRFGLALALALGLAPLGQAKVESLFDFLFQGGLEFLQGLFLGCLVYILFAALELAGNWNWDQLQLMSPRTDNPLSLSFVLMGWILFFQIKGHHMILVALSYSYRVFPGGREMGTAMENLIWLPTVFFTLAFLLALPFLLFFFIGGMAWCIWQRFTQKESRDLFRLAQGGGLFLLLYTFIPWVGKVAENYLQWLGDSMIPA